MRFQKETAHICFNQVNYISWREAAAKAGLLITAAHRRTEQEDNAMTPTNKKLLALLKQNARLSNAELSTMLGISEQEVA